MERKGIRSGSVQKKMRREEKKQHPYEKYKEK